MSSSCSKWNCKLFSSRSAPVTLPCRDQFLGREEIREPTGCSLAFVTLPMRVRVLSFINAEVSISGARMRFLSGPCGCIARLLPFSAALNFLDVMALRRE